MPLNESRRQQLDGIVQKMEQNKESQDAVQFVVNDFKSKYENETQEQPPEKPQGGGIMSFLGTAEKVTNGVRNAVPNFLLGQVKGLASTALGAAQLGSGALESAYNATIGKLTGTEAQKGSELAGQVKEKIKPEGVAQNIGYGTEQFGEFLTGAGEEKLAASIASKVANPKLAKVVNFVTKSLAKGVTQAGQTAVQQGTTDNIGTNFAVGALTPTAEAGMKFGGKLAAKSLGVSTGAGEGAITQAFRDESPEFQKALRGDAGQTMEQVLGQSQEAMQALKTNRSNAYRTKLEQIKDTKVPVDLEKIKSDTLNKIQKDYGVKILENGDLDFSRSTISDKAEAERIKSVLHNVFDWGSQAGDDTVLGVDTLKRRLDDFYSPSSEVRGLVTSLRNDVKKQITKAVPEYEEMTRGYAEATEHIKDIQHALSVKGTSQTNADTAIRKLASIFRENNELRREFVDALSEVGGKNLAGQIAGAQLSSWMPRGLIAKLGSGVALTQIANPASIPALAAASPRVVGEFMSVLGKGYRASTPLAGAAIKGATSLAEQSQQQ